jgi:5-methylcytosine-specific restriction endonuclease McrA
MNTQSEDQIVEQLRNYRIGEWNARQGLKQAFRCAYCDCDFLASFHNYNSWVWDHITPQSRGGDDTFDNIVITCRPCNFLKRDYLPSGDTRDDRISDARRYVQQLLAQYEAEVVSIRDLVRPTNQSPNERSA